jgi:hypothetical protein
MNLSLGRLLQGILGAILSDVFYLTGFNHSYSKNITTIITISAVSFFACFLWGDHIFKALSKIFPLDPLLNNLPKKEKNDKREQ